MATAPTRPDPAKGQRTDESAAEQERRSREHHSSDEPAEGADDLPEGGHGAPE
jgi:hypothetical protein